MLLHVYLCTVGVFKVVFNGLDAVGVHPAPDLEHGDMAFLGNTDTVLWFAVDSPDADTAMQVADAVVKTLWGPGEK